ncbi:MAG: hypothetical protein M3Q39_11225 [Actinomycetota bacterium]|nr:hypothetical protein [Actinomycetota bacterium]
MDLAPGQFVGRCERCQVATVHAQVAGALRCLALKSAHFSELRCVGGGETFSTPID